MHGDWGLGFQTGGTDAACREAGKPKAWLPWKQEARWCRAVVPVVVVTGDGEWPDEKRCVVIWCACTPVVD